MGATAAATVTALATRHEAERRTRVLTGAAAILNTLWLAGHLAIGVCWQVATARATELLGYRPTFSGWDPLLMVLWPVGMYLLAGYGLAVAA